MKNQTVRIWVAATHLLLLTALLIFVMSACDNDDTEQGPPLVIESISPIKARVGETITITGTGFIAKPSRNDIGFTGRSSPIPAQVLEATATMLKIKVPLEALDGPIAIMVGAQTVTSSQSFTLDTSLGAPTVASISPDNGFVNTEVTITGTNFGTDKNVMKVLFGNTAVTDILAITDKTVKVKAPVSLPAGEVDVKVEREGQPSVASVKFTVKEAPPTVTTAYYLTTQSVIKGVIDATGIRKEVLYDISDIFTQGISVDFDGGYIYWGMVDGVARAPLNGGAIEQIYADPEHMLYTGDVVVDHEADAVYFSCFDPSFSYAYIMKGNLDGTAPLTVVFEDVPDNIAFNLKLSTATHTLYWAESTSQRIRAASLSGSFTPVTLFDASHGLKNPTGVALDEKAGKLYITNRGDFPFAGNIQVGNLDGSGTLTELVPGGPDVRYPYETEIDPVNGYIFWVNSVVGESPDCSIMRVKLDGTGIQMMFDGFQNAFSLTLDTR